jgi:hypothetical protein
MAYFAEIDENNKVLRVVVACDTDIANNGGDLSEQASEYFKSKVPLSINGIKWIQTFSNGEFRKQKAAINFTYDSFKDKFISPQPYPSWSLDSNDDWQPPIVKPELTLEQKQNNNFYIWNETNENWDLINQ